MKVFLYCPVDTGGQSARLAKALREYEGIEAYSMATRQHLNRYPEDLRFDPDKARTLIAAADVVHLHNSLEVPKRFELRDDKPLVLHHHGSRFREHHARIWPEAAKRGAIQIASTIDLTLLHPGVIWLPTPHNLVALQAYRDVALKHRGNRKRMRIAHAPTNRKVKSTTIVMAAITRLHERGIPVELELIERVSWATCLARKATADVVVDQLHLGIGNNAIEAMAMGIPVIAGVDDQNVREAMEATYGRPFLYADEGTLEMRLRELQEQPDVRQEFGLRGLDYAHQFHDERYVANRLARIYRMVLAREAVT